MSWPRFNLAMICGLGAPSRDKLEKAWAFQPHALLMLAEGFLADVRLQAARTFWLAGETSELSQCHPAERPGSRGEHHSA